MKDEIEKLRLCLRSSMISERNHIFKYTSPLINPTHKDAKAVYKEYDTATRDERFHNYNVQKSPYPENHIEELHVPTIKEFLVKKLRYQFGRDRKTYIENRILSNFTIVDDDGNVEEYLIYDYDFMGESNNEIFSLWQLFEHLFELEKEIANRIEASNFTDVRNHLDLIDETFGFLMDQKNSYFNFRMNTDELYNWLLCEITDFQHQVEEQGLDRALRDEPEKHCQWVFTAALKRISEVYDVCMLAEPDVGRGSVDFTFSQGSHAKVCVELKLSASNSVFSGFTQQLPQYMNSVETEKGIFVVIDSGKPSSSFRKLLEFIDDEKKECRSHPDIIVIDATQKASASQLK